jgi:hypothetical protein
MEEGKIRRIQKTCTRYKRVVEASEPDIINYIYYLERDESKCIVNEQT